MTYIEAKERALAECESCADDFEYKATIVKALKKQIPKKLIKEGEQRSLLLCPICESYNGYFENKLVFGKENKYCWNCGQAIDWSE